MCLVSLVPLVSLVSVAVSVRCFGDSSACSASGVIGVSSCISEVLLVTIVPEVPMVSLVFVAVSIRYMLW